MGENIHNQIRELIFEVTNALGLPKTDFSLDHPASEAYGDYACNVAMVLYPILKKEDRGEEYQNPRALADAIVQHFKTNIKNLKFLDKVELAGPGFINFTLSKKYLLEHSKTILTKSDQYGQNTINLKENIVVEYTDPNPFKEFHIGHVYSNTIGESLARILEASGAKVWRADYFGDIGVHVAKAVWIIYQEFQKNTNLLTDLATKSIHERQQFLGKCYVRGAVAYESEPEAKKLIDILNTHLYPISQKLHTEESAWKPVIAYQKYVISPETYDSEILYNIYRLGRKWSLEYFETLYQRLGTKFDGYYPESKVGEIGYQLVQENLDNGVFQKSQGAIVFDGEKLGLHTRVFINKNNLPTYEAKELGLAPSKYQDFAYSKSVIVTGNEINEYFKVLIAALKLINPKLGNVTTHLGHGMVRLPEGKMSSRSGNIVTGDALIDQAKAEALKIINSLNPSLSKKDLVADQIGIAAIKYTFLKSNVGDDVVFKMNEALSFSGNSGPYLQYTHARCRSVLSKSKFNYSEILTIEPFNHLTINNEELSLLRWFYRYPEVVSEAAQNLSPHLICTYLFELAQRFNAFYNQHSILGSDERPVNQKTSQLRLTHAAVTAQILKNGLYLLGIHAPEKM